MIQAEEIEQSISNWYSILSYIKEEFTSFGNSSAGPWFSKKSKGLVHLGIIVQFRYLGLGSSGSELPVIF